MEVENLEIVQLELKYCEYCGSLWLRPRGETEVYCAGCISYVAHCAQQRGRHGKVRLPINGREDVFLCSEGGNA